MTHFLHGTMLDPQRGQILPGESNNNSTLQVTVKTIGPEEQRPYFNGGIALNPPVLSNLKLCLGKKNYNS